MNLINIYKSLDHWVSINANGKYYSDDFIEEKEENLIVDESYGIQQNRKEIFSFIKTLLKKKQRNICLEIGIGHVGSTHFLFRHLFKKTITIELDKNRVFDFRDRLTKYCNKYVLDDGKSHFVYGSSSDSLTILKIINFLKNKKIDLLFIDGSHIFKDVLTDWLIYKNFVANRGIIAFHDCNNRINNDGGVPKLINFIKKNDKKIKIRKIVYSKNMGIAYYFVQK
jgi:predicted O-methyltransferase YrrM